MVNAERVSSNTRRVAYPDVGYWFVQQYLELTCGRAGDAVAQFQLCERPPNNEINHGKNGYTTKRQLIRRRGPRHDRKSESRRDGLFHHLGPADTHRVLESHPASRERVLGDVAGAR